MKRIVLLGLIALGLIGCGDSAGPIITTESALYGIDATKYYVASSGTRNGVGNTNGGMNITLTPDVPGNSYNVAMTAASGSYLPLQCNYKILRYSINYVNPPYSYPAGAFAGTQDVWINQAGQCYCGRLNGGWQPLPSDFFRMYYTSSGYQYLAAEPGGGSYVCGDQWINLRGYAWPQY